MSLTYTPEQVIRRLEDFKRSLEAARDVEHPEGIRKAIPQWLQGHREGIQHTIIALETEIRMIRAGAKAANKVLHPNTNNEG